MVKIYYKAVRPDGKDFHTGTLDYASALGGKVQVTSKARKLTAICCTESVLHASDVPAATLIGGSWPCRLFEVTGRPVAQEDHKYGFRTINVVREIDGHLALGPNGQKVAALIDRVKSCTAEEITGLDAARDAAWDAAWGAARDAAWDAAWGAAWDAAWGAARDAAWGAAWDAAWGAARDAAWGAARDAAWDAVLALISQDLITEGQFRLLIGPWASVIGDEWLM